MIAMSWVVRHVDQMCCVAGQGHGADDARGRPRQNRLHRTLTGHIGADERAIALDDHHGRHDIPSGQGGGDGIEQVTHERDEAGIERHRGGPPQRVQSAAQLVAAGDGFAREAVHQFACRQLVGRVASAKVPRDGKRGHLIAMGFGGALDGLQIKRSTRALLSGRALTMHSEVY